MSKLFLCPPNVVLGFITTNPKFDPLSQKHSSFPISLRFRCCTAATTTTTTITASESDTHPFAVSYLINNFDFSPESALKYFNSNKVRFNTLEKPNSVITFLKNNGFSHSDIRIIITKSPWLLSSKPHKTLLPKFQFFLSKGVSSSDIVSLLTANPGILLHGLKKRIIPLFELLSRFLKTDKHVIVRLIRQWHSFDCMSYDLIVANINLMSDFGVCNSAIAVFFQTNTSIFGSTDLIKSLEEVKGLGFDPSTTTFGVALMAKKCMSKTLWNQKVDVFKKWGWSDEAIFQAFRSYPNLMMVSIDKINLLMTFWVNQMGWHSLALTKSPNMFTYSLHKSLHKRIIPRASILQYLLMKGLRKNNASLVMPFSYNEKMFLSKFVFSFKEESDYLLKVYEEKMKTTACHSLNREWLRGFSK
ncbi:uncharacterized protein LOC123887150 isoform X2 [Trifolium pratense]|uniref:uncharacterized protein LOC123887150 isoform X2 n=1 Tax=Trifolium pratense TaxID=57577 RepID=UPI001E696900|nr:uncharacterized protein LOC123887150 isoform X2 [Trifolium pratense]